MALLTGMTADGLEVPVQVLPDGKLVAEGLEGRDGKDGAAAVIGGTASLPGLHPPADENTGLYSDAADTLGVSTAGVSHIRISSRGSLALGPGSIGAPTLISQTTPLTGGYNVYSLYAKQEIQSDVQGGATIFATTPSTASKPFRLLNIQHYVASQGEIGVGSSVETQVGFFAAHTLSGADGNVGFWSSLPAGPKNYNFLADNTADSLFRSGNFIFANGGTEKARFNPAGQLLIGRDVGVAGSAAKLQCTSTVNLSVSVYADNNSARSAGLVSGDIYRKADGTLMITF